MQLSLNERRLLLDILEAHLEGMEAAKEEMLEDTVTLSDFDTFTETFQAHDQDRMTVESIKAKVVEYDDSGDGD